MSPFHLILWWVWLAVAGWDVVKLDGLLDDWIASTRQADLSHLHAFTRGLAQDRDAVNAAVTLPYHNGGTEGVNAKTKRPSRSSTYRTT